VHRRVSRGTGSYVFSSILRGKATDKSDGDILIKLELGRSLPDIVAIKQDLEYFECKIDLVLKTQSALTFASKSSGTLSAF
jgi:predicted nucleotidyltransferase